MVTVMMITEKDGAEEGVPSEEETQTIQTHNSSPGLRSQVVKGRTIELSAREKKRETEELNSVREGRTKHISEGTILFQLSHKVL